MTHLHYDPLLCFISTLTNCTMTHCTMVHIHDSSVPWSTGPWPIYSYNWPAMTCIHKLLITYLNYINRRSARAQGDIGYRREIRYTTHNTSSTELQSGASTYHYIECIIVINGFCTIIINNSDYQDCLALPSVHWANNNIIGLNCDSPSSRILHQTETSQNALKDYITANLRGYRQSSRRNYWLLSVNKSH